MGKSGMDEEKNENKGPQEAYIGLGSNLGNREQNILLALRKLDERGQKAVTVSSLIETQAVDCPPGSPSFLNGAARLAPSVSPRELMRIMGEIETEMGRRRWPGQIHEPRIIDLDLLLFGDHLLDEQGLTLPHPRFHLRPFVLIPMAQIAPHTVHPRLKKTMAQLLYDRNSHLCLGL